ncbi:hypothetical protein B0H12DRAFT_380900 [Mycena haematopus]|nr:hypothetical protein B0H12DRAFT_380900 [Mycena haematopus]
MWDAFQARSSYRRPYLQYSTSTWMRTVPTSHGHVQYTIGIATGVPVFFVSVGESYQDDDLEGFLDIVNFLSAEDDVSNVMSKALAFKLLEAYTALYAHGTSILFAASTAARTRAARSIRPYSSPAARTSPASPPPQHLLRHRLHLLQRRPLQLLASVSAPEAARRAPSHRPYCYAVDVGLVPGSGDCIPDT